MNKTILTLGLLLVMTTASATTIEYTASNTGGTSWQYNYTVSNDSLAFDIDEFTIFFDYTLYANLQAGPGTPTDWDPLTIQPDLALQDDGFYDALELGGGVASGDSLSGFSVTFDYLGAGTPGAQAWEVLDPSTFATLDSGVTVAAATMQVPEPGIRWLLVAGLIAVWAARARARRTA